MQSNAAALLDALTREGIDHVFANAGTDSAPIIEALAAAAKTNEPTPRFHVVPHENLAMAMALGYYRFGRKMAGVLLHTTVGSANAVMGAMNARRDRTPILMLAGRTPHTESGQHGSRSAHIHWGQDSFDQAAMLREWCKWTYELKADQPVGTLIARASSIARSPPCGPVYLTLPRETLSAPAVEGHATIAASAPMLAPPETVEQIADAIRTAEFPVLITSSGGREPEAFELLADIADSQAIAIAQPFATDVNLPSDHPMNFGMEGMQLVSQADVLLVLESGVPWLSQPLRNDVQVFQVAADSQYTDYPLRSHQSDLSVTASPVGFLRALALALAETVAKPAERRRRRFTELNAQRRARLAHAIEQGRQQTPISTAWLAHAVNEVKSPDTRLVNELGVPADFLELTAPCSYVRESTAGGLGFGLGAAIGARLAQPGQPVIAVVGDGSYMFGNPTPAHFVSRALNLGTLTIINNNQRWQAVHQAASAMYPDGDAVAADSMPLTALAPSPEFEKVVEASDGHGEKVTNPDDLYSAIERGLMAADDGRPAVLNVLTTP